MREGKNRYGNDVLENHSMVPPRENVIHLAHREKTYVVALQICERL